MKIAIVGAAGFIGHHLTKTLAQEPSNQLLLFGRQTSNEMLSRYGTYHVFQPHDSALIKNQFKEVDLVYYLASASIPASTWNQPMLEITNNLQPFVSFMEALVETGCKKIAFVSSAGTVYGSTKGKVDESYPRKPIAPYGIIKCAMENFLEYYQVKCDIQTDIYRVSNVYGEGQDISKGLGVINIFLHKIKTEGKVTVFGDGSNTRNYIYVGDVARLLMLSKENMDQSGIYNVSSFDTYSINELIEKLKEAMRQSFQVEYLPGRQSDNSFIDLDNSRILNFFPDFKFMSIIEGIRLTNSMK